METKITEMEKENIIKEYMDNRKRILVYVCPDCESIRRDTGSIGAVCRKKNHHVDNEKAIRMKLGELFVSMEE